MRAQSDNNLRGKRLSLLAARGEHGVRGVPMHCAAKARRACSLSRSLAPSLSRSLSSSLSLSFLLARLLARSRAHACALERMRTCTRLRARPPAHPAHLHACPDARARKQTCGRTRERVRTSKRTHTRARAHALLAWHARAQRWPGMRLWCSLPSARSVPAQCPHSARTVPAQCPLQKHSRLRMRRVTKEF